MSEIKFKVSKDGNEKKYIPLIRKMLSRSLSEIRECLSNNGYIDICSLENIEGREGPPHEPDAALGEARAHEHPGLLDEKSRHRAEKEDDDRLVPAKTQVVEVLIDRLVRGMPAREEAAQAAHALRPGKLALEDVLGLLQRALGELDLLLAQTVAAREPLPEEDDHAHEPLYHGKEEHHEDEGEEHVLSDSLEDGKNARQA